MRRTMIIDGKLWQAEGENLFSAWEIIISSDLRINISAPYYPWVDVITDKFES